MEAPTGRSDKVGVRKRADTCAEWTISELAGLRNRNRRRERAYAVMLVVMKRAVQTAFCLAAVLLMVHTVTPPTFSGWVLVTVRPGATEWSIANSHCPDADPRDVVAAIEQHNHIDDLIQPGEQIWVPTAAHHSWWILQIGQRR